MNSLKTKLVLITSAIFILFFSSNLYAQNSDLEDILDKYSNIDGFESVEISGGLLKAFSKSSTTDDLVNGLASIRVLSINKASTQDEINYKSLMAEISKIIKRDEYEKVMGVKSSGDNVEIYLSSDNSKSGSKQTDGIGALLIVADENKSFAIVYIKGKITQQVVDGVIKGDIQIM